jgi:hypothetical protein
MADLMQKLGEEDLLHIVQMVHDHKSPDTYYKNDVEREFSLHPAPVSEAAILTCPFNRGRIPC